jgi:hypothetical protein
MSWAAHNPELYEQICKRGIAWKLQREIARNGFDPRDAEEMMANIVEVLYETFGNTLSGWASEEISESEGSYFGDLADAAKEQHDER